MATEIIARYNANELDIKIEQLILTNGSIHIELSQLRTIQKLLKHKFLGKYVAKLTNFLIFKKNMKNIYFDTSKVTDNELKEMKELYLEEYVKASARIKHITSVLLRLGVDLPANGSFNLPLQASSENISGPPKKGNVSRKKPCFNSVLG